MKKVIITMVMLGLAILVFCLDESPAEAEIKALQNYEPKFVSTGRTMNISYISLTRIDEYYPLTYDDAVIMAQTIYGEAGGCDDYEKYKVAVCILNRYDEPDRWGSDIATICRKSQFNGYDSDNPVLDEDLEIVAEAIADWNEWHDGTSNNWLYINSFQADGTGLHNNCYWQ